MPFFPNNYSFLRGYYGVIVTIPPEQVNTYGNNQVIYYIENQVPSIPLDLIYRTIKEKPKKEPKWKQVNWSE